ncbi:phage antirepressor [Bifidobacterium panos]|uniref:Antirepressor n=1 Tax=Bifidobacterium panos TaxID=2675321 RepID=A0ABX1SZI1_9BIFI|nr:phage antirepressor KilAC domain-containing protein [Bifidobacterium sp. DSM 109963]NMN02755.1 antirepressor [Bifidobacterium sp. DSM 109963]
MSDIQVFDFKGATVRTLADKQGEPWFVLKDCMDVLGIGNPTETVKMFDEDEFSTTEVIDSIGRRQQAYVISEPGLYRLVMKSRKPEAKDFQRWVTHEVLPQIRRTGGYIPQGETPEETLARAVIIAQKTLDEQARRIKQQDRQLEAQAPKVLFADSVAASDSSILVGELARDLRQNGVNIGQNRLFQWLRDNGYLVRRRGESWNEPTQKSVEQGLFEVKTRSFNNPDGSTFVRRTTKITGKGRIYFTNKFLARRVAA